MLLDRFHTRAAADAETAGALNLAELLLSAVADEKNGIPNAVRSIESWAADETRFSAAWVAAVRELVKGGREVARTDE
jgi:hypothetical protein